jgi:hypothetical protein
MGRAYVLIFGTILGRKRKPVNRDESVAPPTFNRNSALRDFIIEERKQLVRAVDGWQDHDERKWP